MDQQPDTTSLISLQNAYNKLQASKDELQATVDRLNRILEGSDQGFWDWDLVNNTFTVSERFESMLGYTLGERDMTPSMWGQYVHPEDLAKAQASIADHLAGRSPKHELPLRCLTKSGDWKWIQTSGRVVKRAADGTPLLMSGTHTDISDSKKREQAFSDQAALIDLAHDAIIVRSFDGSINMWSKGAERTYGWPQSQALHKMTHELLQTRFPVSLTEIQAILLAKGYWEGKLEHQTRHGETIVVTSRWVLKHNDAGQPVSVMEINRDITEQERLLKQLEQQAHHDALTGLRNRGYFMEQANWELEKAARYGTPLALLILDIDHFKLINDSHGHAVGDIVLKQLGDICRETLRGVDIIGRIGGEEFAVLMPEVGKEAAKIVAERLRHACAEHILPLEHHVRLQFTVSIGISFSTSPDCTFKTLFNKADKALYAAKEAGRNRVCVADDEGCTV